MTIVYFSGRVEISQQIYIQNIGSLSFECNKNIIILSIERIKLISVYQDVITEFFHKQVLNN